MNPNSSTPRPRIVALAPLYCRIIAVFIADFHVISEMGSRVLSHSVPNYLIRQMGAAQ